jgi:hypothetical protein
MEGTLDNIPCDRQHRNVDEQIPAYLAMSTRRTLHKVGQRYWFQVNMIHIGFLRESAKTGVVSSNEHVLVEP